ncbi:MAG: hypothetical protein EP330_20230 [Deltaproteobacteria bacterium]|nr:MAG: hypothetical protein EP330_20230 [Deltaproteobacteria bacterium]
MPHTTAALWDAHYALVDAESALRAATSWPHRWLPGAMTQAQVLAAREQLDMALGRLADVPGVAPHQPIDIPTPRWWMGPLRRMRLDRALSEVEALGQRVVDALARRDAVQGDMDPRWFAEDDGTMGLRGTGGVRNRRNPGQRQNGAGVAMVG